MDTLPRPNRVLWLLGLAVLTISTAGAAWLLHPPWSVVVPPPGETAAADQDVVCFGHVDVESGVSGLSPAQPGRVVRIEVAEDQPVKAGTVLLRLDDSLARLRVVEAEAVLASAETALIQARQLADQQDAKITQQKAAVEVVQHRLSAGRHQLQHKRELQKIGHLRDAEVAAAAELLKEMEAIERVEKSKLSELREFDPRQAVRRAEAEVAAARARLAQAERGVEECLVRAPRDGKVLRRQVAEGDLVTPPSGQPALLFCPDEPRIVRAEVEQEFARWVAVGQEATVQDDTTTAGTTWRGKVVRVSDWMARRRSILLEPGQLNDARTLECVISLEPNQAPLRIGQRVRVVLERATAQAKRP
jgi:multidrug resistance efflux pump